MVNVKDVGIENSYSFILDGSLHVKPLIDDGPLGEYFLISLKTCGVVTRGV